MATLWQDPSDFEDDFTLKELFPPFWVLCFGVISLFLFGPNVVKQLYKPHKHGDDFGTVDILPTFNLRCI